MIIGRRNRPKIIGYSPKRGNTYVSLFMLILLLVPMAASASDTMERISRDREINIGYRTSSVPLSFVEKPALNPLGYNICACTAILYSTKNTLHLADLHITF